MGLGESVPMIAINGKATLPTNYLYPSSLSYVDENENVIEIEVLSDSEYISRLGDDLAKPSLDYPVSNFQNGMIFVNPKAITRIDFIYIRRPITAFFDYVISPTEGIKYLSEGQMYYLLAGEESRTGITTAGTIIASQSKELDFNEEMHPEYMLEILKLMGINLRDVELYQAITQQQQ